MFVLPLLTLVLGMALGLPAQDTEVVGSSVHQTRVEPPQDLQAAGDHSGGDAGKGYRRSHKTRGGDGYKHFDSFQKKDGDSYGYEKHSAFGKGDKGDDGGDYHVSSSYNSGDGGSSGSHQEPKVTSYHFESKSGNPKDYSNYDPETYEGDYSQKVPRRAHPDVEVTGPLQGEPFQSLYDLSGENPVAKRKLKKKSTKSKDPQTAGTEEDAEYDYYEGGEEEGEGDGEGEGESDDGGYEAEVEAEGGDYEGGGESESDYYY